MWRCIREAGQVGISGRLILILILKKRLFKVGRRIGSSGSKWPLGRGSEEEDEEEDDLETKLALVTALIMP
jgi:hypothetical protein